MHSKDQFFLELMCIWLKFSAALPALTLRLRLSNSVKTYRYTSIIESMKNLIHSGEHETTKCWSYIFRTQVVLSRPFRGEKINLFKCDETLMDNRMRHCALEAGPVPGKNFMKCNSENSRKLNKYCTTFSPLRVWIIFLSPRWWFSE